MKKLHIAMAIAASVSTAAIAQAQDYQVEGGFSYWDIDIGTGDTAMKLDGRYHIESVSTSGVVLNEAAFVGRNSNINASYVTVDEADFDITDIGVEWWFEDIYAAANMEDDDGFGTNTLQLGYMLQENTLVALVMQTGDQPEDGMGLRAKYVGELGSNTINLEGQYVDTDGNAATNISGDYYLSDELSLGLGMADSDAAAETEMTVSVKNFFTPTISGEIDYIMDANGTTDANIVALRAAMRF